MIDNIKDVKIISFNTGASMSLGDCCVLEPVISDKSELPWDLKTQYFVPSDELNKLISVSRDMQYVQMHVLVTVCARWHRRSRIRKKWLKRYGTKEEMMLAGGMIDYGSLDTASDGSVIRVDLDLKNFELYPTPYQKKKGYIQRT